MTRRTIAILAGLAALLGFDRALAEESPPPATEAPVYALGFRRDTRFAGEFHRSLDRSVTEKGKGTGAGMAVLFPLADYNFDLGVRYVYVDESRDPRSPDEPTAFTLLTFVFDYFVWPTRLGGLFVGGEIGVTDPAARNFFSVYADYAYVLKLGYEYAFPESRWSATFEMRRSVRDDEPLKATRESHRMSDGLALGVRYRISE